MLNWALAGLDRLRADDWELRLTPTAAEGRGRPVAGVDSIAEFVKECLGQGHHGASDDAECYNAYIKFCGQSEWVPVKRKVFGNVIEDAVNREYGLSIGTISITRRPSARGWKGLKCCAFDAGFGHNGHISFTYAVGKADNC